MSPASSSVRTSAPRPAGTGPEIAVEVGVGFALLVCATLAGMVLVHRPCPNRLDVAGFTLLPASPDSRKYHDIAAIGSFPVLIIGIGFATILSVWRDRARAVACLIGPALAVVVTERIAKPLVGRHVTVLGGNSYPSGTVTAAAALMVVIVLAAPRLFRMLLVLPACGVVLAVSAAVVGMRWHYPTDALGGICVGIGTVLLFDGIAHVPGLLRARRNVPSAAPVRRSPYEDTGPFVPIPR